MPPVPGEAHFATCRGMTRSALLRALVLEATTPADAPLVPDRDELLRLLGAEGSNPSGRIQRQPALRAGHCLLPPVTAPSPFGNRLPASWPPINQRGSRRGGRPHTGGSHGTADPRAAPVSRSPLPLQPRSCAAHHRDGGSARFRRSRGDPRQRRGPGAFDKRDRTPQSRSRSSSSRPARASTAAPTRAPAACPRSLSSRPARASTAAPTRARAACGRTTSRPTRGPAISRLPPMAPRLAPVARPCSRRVLALARPQSDIR